MPSLFTPYQMGPIRLANRIVMAPMERSRARNAGMAADATTALYFAQRAGAGLIITGSISISIEGHGWGFAPAIFTPEQVDAWRRVTAAVHAKGGVIFAQLRHAGRATHNSLVGGQPPVSSVDLQARNSITFGLDAEGTPAMLPPSKPRALNTDEIPRVTREFVQAARNAIASHFDGVEIHAANGYLFDQFINGTLNTRNDRYGGRSIENRLRFTLETVDAVIAAIGSERVGIRLSPFGRYNGIPPFDDEAETYLTLVRELSDRGLAYVHMSDQTKWDVHSEKGKWGADASIPKGFLEELRGAHGGTFILAGGYLKENGQAALDAGHADLIAIGKPFVANPDLVERLRKNWPLNDADHATFYSAGPRGYIDYPVYQQPCDDPGEPGPCEAAIA
jgi:2,4-dienoyl-CoA reductase-like NADH-dependent reductase (Old Yellow Enzyme family)